MKLQLSGGRRYFLYGEGHYQIETKSKSTESSGGEINKSGKQSLKQLVPNLNKDALLDADLSGVKVWLRSSSREPSAPNV